MSDYAVPTYALAVAEQLKVVARRIETGHPPERLGGDLRRLGTILERKT